MFNYSHDGLPSERSWDDRTASFIEPNVILPSQFFTRLQRPAAWTGEQRLMAAILEDAVAVCMRKAPTSAKARTLDRETWAWIRSDDRRWPFSFLRICEALGLAPSPIRDGLRKRREDEAVRTARAAESRMVTNHQAPAPHMAAG